MQTWKLTARLEDGRLFGRVNSILDDLPYGSVLEVIEGASHVTYIEKPFHRDFQDRLLSFLNAAQIQEERNRAT